MPSLPRHLRLPSKASQWKVMFLGSLNFYRVHLLAFTLIPLIMSGIMYGCNTRYHISYIDCLFNCMSAMTVTGLATVNLSTLNPVQQVILFFQMVIGSLTVVSIVMIIVRRHFFQQTFKHVIKEREKRRSSFSLAKTMSRVAPGPPLSAFKKRFSKGDNKQQDAQPKDISSDIQDRSSDEHTPASASVEMKPVHRPKSDNEIHLKPPPQKVKGDKKKGQNISKTMIKRVEGGGVGLVNPMGWYDGQRSEIYGPRADLGESAITDTPDNTPENTRENLSTGLMLENMREEKDRFPGVFVATPARMDSGEEAHTPERTPYAGRPITEETFPRSRTIAFDDGDEGPDRGMATVRENAYFPRSATHRSQGVEVRFPTTGTSSTFPRTYSLRPQVSRKPDARLSGFGGFPTPFELLQSAASKLAPQASRTLTKTLTMPKTATIGRRETLAADNQSGKKVPYISFSATVGRNSRFTGLTEEQMDELGGVEYRALRILLYIVIGYVVFLQIAGFVIIAPYIGANSRYDFVFDGQPRLVRIPWYSLFQSVSAFTNTGMSLVDLSMIPFQRAYLMVFVVFFLIFAGNTAFPVFLRLTVWTIYKLSPTTSRTRETLKFLLDHPRRCFIYLFPATQTWVLALVMVALTLTDWVCFLVLDIGTPEIAALPIGTRIAAAFLQSAAVRAAGFAIVPLASLAPAVKVLYIIMMYISVYPVALSVRATNVYEERSLGLYNEDDESDEFEPDEKGAQAVAKYLGWHARRQLAFDIWWLGFALWLICIIEKSELDKEESASWFNIFNILFELVSGYGTVGLSLGLPYDNYSLCGGFRKLSKLVLILVMLRGRHRGLPVAIDRAVMLPKDFTAAEEQAFEETRSRRLSRRGSTGVPDEFLASLRRGSMTNMSQAANPSHRRESSTPSVYGIRRDSSPGTVRSRSESNPPPSPTNPSLSFSLPSRASGERNRSPVAMKESLTPVKESSMSRAPTRTD